MFNIGVGEIVLILVAALVLLGPERLPEAARTLGKFMREFRRQTDEVRGVVMREIYKIERDLELDGPPKPKPPVEVKSGDQTISILPASGAVARAKPPAPEPAVAAPAPETPPAPKETGS